MASGGGGVHSPNYKRTMLFIDGTNFLIRCGENLGVEIDGQRPPASAYPFAAQLFKFMTMRSDTVIHRRYWCGSYVGNDEEKDQIASQLHGLNFEPVLLKAHQRKEKGVDMALAIHLLVNAFHRNMDVGYLIAGDADYVQLVQEAKRYGCIINVMFWPKGLAPALKLAADEFHDLTSLLYKEALDGRPDLKHAHDGFLRHARELEAEAKARRSKTSPVEPKPEPIKENE